MRQRHDGASLRSAVEFGHDETREGDGGIERCDLRQHVLAGIPVEYQKCLMGRSSQRFANHPTDFAQLLHEMGLGRQATRGVDHHDIGSASNARRDGIKRHSARVAAVLSNHGYIIARAPFGQLGPGGRAERVAGCQQDRLVFAPKQVSQLAD